MLLVRLADREWLRVRPPTTMAPRAWLLGVVAVQLDAHGGRLTRRLRAHLTGQTEPRVMELGESALAHVTLLGPHAPVIPPPPVTPPEPRGAIDLSLFVDGQHLYTVSLARQRLTADASLRAFAHTWCRFLKNGDLEPGFDLTDFLPPSPGKQFARVVSRPLAPGQTVTWLLQSR
jgi:hypothetical protein